MTVHVIIIDYIANPYAQTEEAQLAQAINDIHAWAQWFPDDFIILTEIVNDQD